MVEDIRWKQRFSNYKKSLLNLDVAVNIKNPDLTQKAGIIQFFEISFELAWKLMKDYLIAQGFNEVNSPRASIKKAFEIELIEDGTTWLEALENRNLSTHTYDEATSDIITKEIRTSYYPIMLHLSDKMSQYE
jgi:nucleotidyltransferase substrate binding protein (TIGR01987 family)